MNCNSNTYIKFLKDNDIQCTGMSEGNAYTRAHSAALVHELVHRIPDLVRLLVLRVVHAAGKRA